MKKWIKFKGIEFKSIKTKMLAFFIALLILVCGGLGIVSTKMSQKALENTVKLTLPKLAIEASNNIELEIKK